MSDDKGKVPKKKLKSEPRLDEMPCSETPRRAMELGLDVGPPPSYARSEPDLTKFPPMKPPSPRKLEPVSEAGKANIRVMIAIVEEFNEWLSSLGVDGDGDRKLTRELRAEIYFRFLQVGRLSETLTEFVEDERKANDMTDYNRVYDRFFQPFEAVVQRVNAILNIPKEPSPTGEQPATDPSPAAEQPSTSRAPPDLQPLQPESSTETGVDLSAFEEFKNAIEKSEEAFANLSDLYYDHVMVLMDLSDLKYVRATKTLRDRCARLVVSRKRACNIL